MYPKLISCGSDFSFCKTEILQHWGQEILFWPNFSSELFSMSYTGQERGDLRKKNMVLRITAQVRGSKGTNEFRDKNNPVLCCLYLPVKQNTGKIPCSLFAKGAMLFFFFVIFCAQKNSQSENPHCNCSSRIQPPRPKQKSAKNGEELCTVNIFFKNNTRTKCSS